MRLWKTKQRLVLSFVGWLLCPQMVRAQVVTGPENNPGSAKTSATPTHRKRVALMRLTGLGLSEAIRQKLEELLFSNLRGMNKWEVLDAEKVDAILESSQHRQLRYCDNDPVCMRAQANVLGVDRIIYGTIAALGKDYSLALRSLETLGEAPADKQDVTLDGDLDILIPQIRLIAYKMLAPEKIVGSLAINTALSGIEVSVDGHKMGTTPLPSAIGGLKPGVHQVQLSGFQARRSQVEVHIQPFETTYLAVEIDLIKKSIGSSEQKNTQARPNHD